MSRTSRDFMNSVYEIQKNNIQLLDTVLFLDILVFIGCILFLQRLSATVNWLIIILAGLNFHGFIEENTEIRSQWSHQYDVLSEIGLRWTFGFVHQLNNSYEIHENWCFNGTTFVCILQTLTSSIWQRDGCKLHLPTCTMNRPSFKSRTRTMADIQCGEIDKNKKLILLVFF